MSTYITTNTLEKRENYIEVQIYSFSSRAENFAHRTLGNKGIISTLLRDLIDWTFDQLIKLFDRRN